MEDLAVNAALRSLLKQGEVFSDAPITDEMTADWPEGLLDELLRLEVLEPSDPSTEAVCTGCEERCVVSPEVRRLRGQLQLLHFCTVRDDIGYVRLQTDALRRWTVSRKGLARALNDLFGGVVLEELEFDRLWSVGETPTGRVVFGYSFDDEDDFQGLLVSDSLIIYGKRPVVPDGMKVFSLAETLRVEHHVLTLHPRDRRSLTITSGHPTGPRFEVLPKTRWEDLVIRILDDEHAEFQVGHRCERLSFIELGLADTRKNPPAPKKAWVVLLTFARHDGELGWGHSEAADDIKAQVTILRRALRKTTGLSGNPFYAYVSRRRWETRFILRDRR